MSNVQECLNELLAVDGALAAAVVDAESGMMLGHAGSGIDLELAAAGSTEVIRAKLKTMKALKLNDVIEDILITLGKQYHILRPIASTNGIFLYFVLDKSRSNLAMARRHLQITETSIKI